MAVESQVEEWKAQEALKAVEVAAFPPLDAKKQQNLDGQNALVFAFCLLLSAVQESYHTATTKAKELNAARSQMSKFMNQQKTLKFGVVNQVANHYYTMQVVSNGVVENYFTLTPPTPGNVTTANGGVVAVCLIKNEDWVHASQVQLHSHVGESFWSATINNGINVLPGGCVFTQDPNNGQALNHHSGFQPLTANAINKVENENTTVQKARDYLTGKLNIVKQQSQSQETQINATTDSEGMIIQQGMKIASLLETLASQIGQI